MSNNKDILEVYKNLYDLPEITYNERVNFDFFRSCRKDYKFIVMGIYNEKREFILIRDLIRVSDGN